MQVFFGTDILWLRVEKCFFSKHIEVDVKMHQNRQISVKASELEDQYAIIFSLALWPQEPHEIHFFKKTGFHKKCSFENVKQCQNWDEMGPGWRWRAQI